MTSVPIAAGMAAGAAVVLATGTALADPALFERPADAAPDPESGLVLPEGFVAEVVHDGVGRARHIAVRDNGDIYVRLREPEDGGGIAALRDEDGDGRAERVEYFAEDAGTGIRIHDGHLYASSNAAVHRWSLPEEGLVPEGEAEVVVEGFPEQDSHAAKAFAIDPEGGHLYVNVGAPSNACQEEARTPGSPGMDPCPQLEQHGGLWRFAADETGQNFADGERFVTGVRNVVAIDRHPGTGEIVFVQHGRDQLHELFPDLYSVEENAELPAEELHVASEGADHGWPYTYFDPLRGERMVAPEYGGDGETVAEAGLYQEPLLAFPAHMAPNGLLFYDGGQFPDAFQGGAFIAWHGSWNRAPLEQEGYMVTFVPFEDGRPSGAWHVFADGFAGTEPVEEPDDAEHRPMGLALGPDGALYVADSQIGRIWRIRWQG